MSKRVTRRYDNVVQKGLRGVSHDLRSMLRDQAEDAGMTLNDYAVTLLADAFGLRLDAAREGAPRAQVTDRDSMTLRMPDALRQVIGHAAVDRRVSEESLILDTLSAGVLESAAA